MPEQADTHDKIGVGDAIIELLNADLYLANPKGTNHASNSAPRFITPSRAEEKLESEYTITYREAVTSGVFVHAFAYPEIGGKWTLNSLNKDGGAVWTEGFNAGNKVTVGNNNGTGMWTVTHNGTVIAEADSKKHGYAEAIRYMYQNVPQKESANFPTEPDAIEVFGHDFDTLHEQYQIQPGDEYMRYNNYQSESRDIIEVLDMDGDSPAYIRTLNITNLEERNTDGPHPTRWDFAGAIAAKIEAGEYAPVAKRTKI